MPVHKSLQIKIHKFVGQIGQPKSGPRKRRSQKANLEALSREAGKAGLTRAEFIRFQMERSKKETEGLTFRQSSLSVMDSPYSSGRGRLAW